MTSNWKEIPSTVCAVFEITEKHLSYGYLKMFHLSPQTQLWLVCYGTFNWAPSTEWLKLSETQKRNSFLELWVVQLTQMSALEEEKPAFRSSRSDSWTFSWVWLLHQQIEDSRLSRCTLNTVPHVPSAPEACWPQMVPFLLRPSTLHISTEQWAARCGTKWHRNIPRQMSLLNSSHCADAHRWTCGSLTSWHRYLYRYTLHLTPGHRKLKPFTWFRDFKGDSQVKNVPSQQCALIFSSVSADDVRLTWLQF